MKGGEREEGGREKGMAGESALYARARARERAGRRNVIRKMGGGRNADVPHIG